MPTRARRQSRTPWLIVATPLLLLAAAHAALPFQPAHSLGRGAHAMPRPYFLLIALILLAAVCGRAFASGAYPACFELFGPANGDQWGYAARAVDLDGDGRPELLTGLWSDLTDEAVVQIRR